MKNNFVQLYIDWLKQNIDSYTFENGVTEITVPFLNSYNDHIQIYVIDNGEGSYRLSDDGETYNNLIMSGVTLNTKRRIDIFNKIILGYGVQFNSNTNELYKDCSIESFAQSKNMLIQAMQAVSDMFMLSRSNVSSIFLEDVVSFLDANNILYVPDAQFPGKSGLTHKFNFSIPRTKGRKETLIDVSNKLDEPKVYSILLASTDLVRDSNYAVIVNDIENEVNPEYVDALNNYSIDMFNWSNKEQLLKFA